MTARLWYKLVTTLEMIRFEHTVFALPFALIAVLLAAEGFPPWRGLGWIVLAMVAARSAAMTFNRIVDVAADAANPRTRTRALPAGRLTMGFAVLFTAVMSAVFVFAAAMLNPLCLYLSMPVLAILFGYSYTKRFTAWSHLALGFGIGLAPVGAWIAIRGDVSPTPLLLAAAVTLWIAGFDLIYACQDIDFDRRAGLFSMPARWGAAVALKVSAAAHVGTVLLLVAVARAAGLGVIAHGGIAAVAALLYWEHRLVGPDDLRRLDVAFFNMNGYVSILLLAAVAADVLIA